MLHNKPALIISTIFCYISYLAFIIPCVIWGIYGIALPSPENSVLKVFAYVAVGGCVLGFTTCWRFKLYPVSIDSDVYEMRFISILTAIAGGIYLIAAYFI